MNLRRITAVFGRDLRSSVRDRLIMYVVAMPVVLAIGLRLSIPSAGAASASFALLEGLGDGVEDTFRAHGTVSIHATVEEVERRVAQPDDVAGVACDGQQNLYVIVQGNEEAQVAEMARVVARRALQQVPEVARFQVSDIGLQRSPLATYGFAFLMIMSFLMAGFVIGFNLIEEKEADTLRALVVSPLREAEFLLGRGLVGLVLPFVHLALFLPIVGIGGVRADLLLLVTLASAPFGILLGYGIGVLSGNQISGIAVAKVLFLLGTPPALGALLLPERLQWIFWWAPTYWTFRGYERALLGDLSLAGAAQIAAILLGLSLVAAVAVAGRVREGLRPS